MTDTEKKNKIVGLLISTGVHLVLLVAMFFLIAFRLPNPPFPEMGVSLNLGMYDEGSGDVQPETLAEVTDKVTEDKEPTPQQQQEEVKPVETKEEAAKEIVTEDEESGVVVKEDKKKEVKPDPVKEKVPDKPVEVKKEAKEEKKEVKADSKSTSTSDGGKSTGSQGDDINKKGDKGKPEGTLDPNGQYTGKQGGGGGGDGLALSMSGWAWADKPVIPELPDNADGRIVFEIECDEDGEIVGINTIERGLSPRAEQMLKEEIRKNSLIRLSGGQVPTRSKGRVVFVLKTK